MRIIWEVFVLAGWYWLVVITPAVLGVFGTWQSTLPANKRSGAMIYIYNLIPFWAWWIIAFLAFIITILISTYNYVKKIQDQHKLELSKSVISHDIKTKGDSSPVVQSSGTGNVSVGNTVQYFFPPNNPQSISFATVDGKIEIRHNEQNRIETEFKFIVLNETNKDLKSAVYVDEVAYKSDEDKEWITLSDMLSPRPLRWIPKLLPSIDGHYDIDKGDRLSFVLLSMIKTHNSYNYHLDFFKNKISLPHERAKSHRILIRFHGSQFLGNGITKKLYVYLNEDESGYKKYAGIKEFRGEA